MSQNFMQKVDGIIFWKKMSKKDYHLNNYSGLKLYKILINILAFDFFEKDDKYVFKARNSCCVGNQKS